MRCPPFLQVGNRHPHQMAVAVRRVHPHIVPLGLHPAHLVAGDEPGAPGGLDGDHAGQIVILRWIGLVGRVPERASEGGPQPGPRHWLQQVVARPDFEGANCVLLIGRDEDDGRRRGELAQHASQLDAIERWHPDVEEDYVVVAFLKVAQRVGGILRGIYLRDRERRAQKVAQLIEGRHLIVDDQDGRAKARPEAAVRPGGQRRCRLACRTSLGHAQLTAGQNLGRRIVTLVPAPTPVSMVSPWSLPKIARSRSSTLRSPTD